MTIKEKRDWYDAKVADGLWVIGGLTQSIVIPVWNFISGKKFLDIIKIKSMNDFEKLVNYFSELITDKGAVNYDYIIDSNLEDFFIFTIAECVHHYCVLYKTGIQIPDNIIESLYNAYK